MVASRRQADPDKGSVTTSLPMMSRPARAAARRARRTPAWSRSGPASRLRHSTGSRQPWFTGQPGSQPASTDVTIKLTSSNGSGTATGRPGGLTPRSPRSPFLAGAPTARTTRRHFGQSSVSFDLSTIDDALARRLRNITVSVGEITGGGFEAVRRIRPRARSPPSLPMMSVARAAARLAAEDTLPGLHHRPGLRLGH